MRVTIWGSRGSVPSPAPGNMRYGGNTSCLEVRGEEGTLLVLDAGTGIRGLGASLPSDLARVDIMLTHLHMDHIQGLGFFPPLRRARTDVHIWGPSDTSSLISRLRRYLSPPLFPVDLQDMPCSLHIHELPGAHSVVEIGEFKVSAEAVTHTGPTLGYRVEGRSGSLAYLPDHEPALGHRDLQPGEQLSGYSLAREVDLLAHDAQYTCEEYDARVGWGHSSMLHAFQFAERTGVARLLPFHHDPSRDDDHLDRLIGDAHQLRDWPFQVVPGVEGLTY